MIDLPAAKDLTPNISALMRRCKLTDWVESVFHREGFHWVLKQWIADNDRSFDFCYLDGGHDWTTTGFAFYLVEKLLRPGGWLLFDDLRWSVSKDHLPRATKQDRERWRKSHSREYLDEHQVGCVFDLLVRSHPSIEVCYVDEARRSWGWARKKGAQKELRKDQLRESLLSLFSDAQTVVAG